MPIYNGAKRRLALSIVPRRWTQHHRLITNPWQVPVNPIFSPEGLEFRQYLIPIPKTGKSSETN